ncbi:MAG: hypothetical protein JXB88_19905 [Spirochaetales bacterium]|nr:hypothetical protein [Spirochaetales bacterium]
MKKFIAVFLLFFLIILIIFTISLPLFLAFMKIHIFTEIERMLLSIIITFLSVILGFRILKFQDTSIRKWKSAVISACDNLIAMSAQARNLKESQENSRKKIEEYLSDYNEPELNNLKTVLDIKCQSCTEHVDHLKMQIDTSLDHWENVIEGLCDSPYCMQMHNAIDKKRQKLNIE